MDWRQIPDVQKALKLAFIKLQQVGGFNQVDGVTTPDQTAYNQILDAIHTFDPAFAFGKAPHVPRFTVPHAFEPTEPGNDTCQVCGKYQKYEKFHKL